MKKNTVIKITFPMLSLLGLTKLFAQEVPVLKPITISGIQKERAGAVVTITKIEKPWIASRKLVIKKFIESIPQYSKITGLLNKSFAFTREHTLFGGIYLWENELAAKKWFNDKWFERVKKTYKSSGEVLYYWVQSIKVLKTITATKGNYWSVVSLGKSTIDESAKGLLRVIYIIDDKETYGHISLWDSENTAKAYFKNDLSANEFFDTPILLNNE